MNRRRTYIVLLLFLCFLNIKAFGQQLIEIKTYFDHDTLLLKERFTINQLNELNGKYESFFASGNKKSTGYYLTNKADSLWKYYYENGSLKTEGHLHDGQKTGVWSFFYENSHPRMKGEMAGEKRTGKWTFYYENGEEKSIGYYEDNKKENVWNYFYEGGKLKAQAFYKNGSGEYKELYPSGSLKMEGFNSQQKSVGKWKYYYETGELEAQGLFKNGSQNGQWKHYHKNGNISALGEYQSGKKNGLWKYYYPDGKLSSEGVEKAGEKDGFWKLYYESGETKGEGKFKDGTGKLLEFYENGKQKSTGNIINGRKEGKWKYFNDNGLEEGYALFRRGVGNYKGYYEDGILKMEGTIEDNKRTGIWKLYNNDGSLAGYYKPIYENDKPVFKTTNSFAEDKKFDKPEYRVKKNKSRYFKPVVNEYKGYILSANPAMSLLGFFPLSLERYKQERLGYEVTASYLRSPFFKRSKEIPLNDAYYNGLSFNMRQKLYSKEGYSGMFYFGHQVTYTALKHRVKTVIPAGSILKANENSYSYDIILGTRWLKNPENGGFTWDAHIGIGIGYKNFSRSYDPSGFTDAYFNEVDKDGLIFPIRFGLTFGFLRPKKNTTPVKIKSF